MRPFVIATTVSLLCVLSIAAGCDSSTTSSGAPVGDTTADGTTADTVAKDTGGEGLVDVASSDGASAETTSLDTVPSGDTLVTADTPVGDGTTADTAAGPMLTIVVEGSLEDKAPDDGLGAQTPDPYLYGLQTLEMLTAEDDPTPAIIFDHAPGFIMVDMHGSTVVAEVPIASLPDGAFPFFRITLTHLDAEVEATLHDVPYIGTSQGPLHILFALSDVAHGDLTMDQGDAEITVTVGTVTQTIPSHWDVSLPSPSPYSWSDTTGGKTRITFYLLPQLEISSEVGEDVTYVIRYYIKDGFRWVDQDEAEFQAGVWDLSVGPPSSAEPVMRFGANHYEVFYQE